jgi:hypothetical protein
VQDALQDEQNDYVEVNPFEIYSNEEEDYVAVNPYVITSAQVSTQITDTESNRAVKLIANYRELAKIYATPSPNWLNLILRQDQTNWLELILRQDQTIEQLVKLAYLWSDRYDWGIAGDATEQISLRGLTLIDEKTPINNENVDR